MLSSLFLNLNIYAANSRGHSHVCMQVPPTFLECDWAIVPGRARKISATGCQIHDTQWFSRPQQCHCTRVRPRDQPHVCGGRRATAKWRLTRHVGQVLKAQGTRVTPHSCRPFGGGQAKDYQRHRRCSRALACKQQEAEEGGRCVGAPDDADVTGRIRSLIKRLVHNSTRIARSS